MPVTMPPTQNALGQKVIVILDEPPAAASGIPTLAEVNAAFFAQLHTYTPFNVTPTQNTGEGPRKVGAKTAPQQNGLVTYPAVDIQYSYLPQKTATPGAAGNELYELLVPGVKRTVVVFDGLDGEETDAISANDVGDVYIIEPGVKRKGATDENEYGQFSVTQSCVISGGAPVAEDHKFAA